MSSALGACRVCFSTAIVRGSPDLDLFTWPSALKNSSFMLSFAIKVGFLSAFALCLSWWRFERLVSLWVLIGDASKLVASFELTPQEVTASPEPHDFDTFAGLLGTLAVGRVSSRGA